MRPRFWMAAVVTIGWLQTAVPPAQAQQVDRWQVELLGGVYVPTDREVQNVYGGMSNFELALNVPLSRVARLRFFADAQRGSGDPYYNFPDFDAGDAATLSRGAAGVSLLFGTPFYAGTRAFLGAGTYAVLAREEIRGVSKNSGQGLGAILNILAYFRLRPELELVVSPSIRFEEIYFRAGKSRYRFNFNGARLMLGLAFSPEG